MSHDDEYDVQSIKVLEGLEAVRRRPGMYIGNTDDGSGLHNMVHEVLANALDEAGAGHGDYITLTIHGDREITIEDRGRGIPVDIHPQSGLSSVEVIFTTLFASGAFGQTDYKTSLGLYGVGLAAVNALSEHLTVDVFRDGAHWRQRHERGTPCAPLERVREAPNTGTRVRLSADPEIFVDPVLDYDTLAARLETLAWMYPSVTLEIFDHRDDRHASFHTPGGMFEALTGPRQAEDVLYVCTTHERILVEFALRPTCWSEPPRTFVNGLETPEHGAHLRGLARALHGVLLSDTARAWRDVFDHHGVGGASLLRECFELMIHVRVPSPQFTGATKRKLASPEVSEAVAQVATPAFEAWLKERGGDVDRAFDHWSSM